MFDHSSFVQNAIEKKFELTCDWNHLVNGKYLRNCLPFERNPIMCFSPDGLLLAYKSSSNKISIIQTKSGKCINANLTLENQYNTLKFSSDSRLLIYTDNDRIKYWDIIEQKHLHHDMIHRCGLKQAISISPIGTILACEGRFGQIIVWDYKLRTILKLLLNFTQHQSIADFSYQGNLFVSIQFANWIYFLNSLQKYRLKTVLRTRTIMFNLKSSRILKVSSGYHFDLKYSLNQCSPAYFSPDGRYVVFTRHDNSVCVRRI